MSFLGKIRVIMLKGEKGDQGEAGTTGDYAGLTNKPSINNVVLSGDTSSDDLGIASQTAFQVLLESLDEIILSKHPVGSILMSAENVNPSTYLGGTWVAWGSGRVPVGVDTTQTEFDTVEETGGEKTHTLIASEIPEHTHTVYDTYPVIGSDPIGVSTGSTYIAKLDEVESVLRTTSAVGSSGSHNNLQPYITCYMWKRTA